MGRSGGTTRGAAISRGLDLRVLVRGSRLPPEMAQALGNDWRETERIVEAARERALFDDQPLLGMSFILTGKFDRVNPSWHPREKLAQRLRALGAEVTTSGASDAKVRRSSGVIVGDLDKFGGSSDKTRKAQAYGIPLLFAGDVERLLAGDRAAVNGT